MEDVDGQSFGDRVRLSRERMRTPEGRRWTQDDLAQALNVKRNTVSRWENGRMRPQDPAIISALARVLRVSAEWLLAGFDRDALIGSVHERPTAAYGMHTSAESLPAPAADLVFKYIDRLLSNGCTQVQAQEAERILVSGAMNGLARRPFAQREMKEIISDIDAAWDFVSHVLRRHGIRA